jgi:hypothetical protein
MRILPLLIVTATTLAASAQVTDEAIERAIAAGRHQRILGAVEVGSTATRQFSVRLAGAVARIGMAASEAALEGEPFGPEQVTPEMLAPTLRIVAYPNDPEFRVGRNVSTPPAQRIVLEATGRGRSRTAVEPVRTETFPIRWSSAIGARIDGQGVIADFDRSALPDGEFDVVVHTTGGAQRYRVRPADLERVQ